MKIFWPHVNNKKHILRLFGAVHFFHLDLCFQNTCIFWLQKPIFQIWELKLKKLELPEPYNFILHYLQIFYRFLHYLQILHYFTLFLHYFTLLYYYIIITLLYYFTLFLHYFIFLLFLHILHYLQIFTLFTDFFGNFRKEPLLHEIRN